MRPAALAAAIAVSVALAGLAVFVTLREEHVPAAHEAAAARHAILGDLPAALAEMQLALARDTALRIMRLWGPEDLADVNAALGNYEVALVELERAAGARSPAPMRALPPCGRA